MTGNEVVEVEKSESPLDISEEDAEVLRAYRIFENGDGLKIYNDLMETFYFFESEGTNETINEIPDPYREYVKAGCRMVMDQIKLATKIAEAIK